MQNLNLNGSQTRVDDETAQRIVNIVKKPKIVDFLNSYWTDEKLGKHPDLKDDHGDILSKTLIVDPDEFKRDIDKHILKLGNMSGDLDDLIRGSIDGDLKQSYIPMSMAVTTSEPAIGKGEFLFASLFSNIGFSENAGDLIDLHTKSRIEVKGISAPLGNGKNQRFKQLSRNLMGTVARALEINDMSEWNLDEENANKIKKGIGLDKQRAARVFTYLQNINHENEGMARTATELYFEKKQLIRTVAAMHLLAYMTVEKDDYILIVNDKRFSMFKTPANLQEAYSIVEKLNIKPWRVGDYGIKVTLRS